MRKSLSYIFVLATLVSCQKEAMESQFLNGTEKTPIVIATNLETSQVVTKASDNKFEVNDALNAYIKHVTVENSSANPLVYKADVTGDGVGPRLADFTVSTINAGYLGVADNYTNHSASSTLSVTGGLYWDDFSNSASEDTDLRTDKHALMVYYGYGYNGGAPSPALDPVSGVLGWTVSSDQKTAGIKSSDLLYAGTQAPVAYSHGTAITADHGVLNIPYTHAMSKVTVVVNCNEGFEADASKNFGSAIVTLKGVATQTAVTAPTKTVTKGTVLADVTMSKGSVTGGNKTCTYTAVIAPTVIKGADAAFITLAGFDGNNYDVKLTDAILAAGSPAWSTKLAAYDAASVTPESTSGYNAANGGLTIPGVNYKITVTIDKQAISVNATIADWTEVAAEGNGEIKISHDITDKTGDMASDLQTGGFDLYKSANVSPAEYGAKATTYSYTAPDWVCTPKIYWPNVTDKFYFRALSPAGSTLAMSNGADVLWGTTAAHSGTDAEGTSYNISEGALIAPRTGDVPMVFKHAMSKITINIVDENKDVTVPGVDPADYTNPLNPRLDLRNATIQLTDLATAGTLNLHDGSITPAAITPGQKTFSEDMGATPKRYGFFAAAENGTATTYAADKTVKNYIVTPQTIGNAAMLTITLQNGAVYKAQLNLCRETVSPNPVINKWVEGKHYTYTITLSKEQITLRALVRNWDETTGSGNADLEW